MDQHRWTRRDFSRALLAAPLLVGREWPTPAGAPPADDVVDLLCWMVRIDTQNPPTDGKTWRETELNSALASLLNSRGVAAQVIESAPGRGSLVARLKGSGRRKPLLLTTHVDVVGAEASAWKHPPFAADADANFIYGRGTLDNKAMAAALVVVMLKLARSRTPLARDLILCLVADEEGGGRQGMQFLVDNHWDAIASEVALGEGDPPLLRDGRVVHIPIQCGEKKSYVVKLRARGTAGHASTPLADNSILLLSNAVSRLQPYVTSLHVTPLAREYLRRMVALEPAPLSDALRSVALQGAEAPAAALETVARASAVYNSLLRATVCPTLLQAGTRANVIPAEAESTLNIRLLPDQNIEDVLGELRRVIASDRVSLEAAPRSTADGPATSHETEYFRALEEVSSRLWPGLVTLPYMAPAASDARYLRARGVIVYGVFPFPATYEEFMTIHAADERVRIRSLREGTDWLHRVTLAIASA